MTSQFLPAKDFRAGDLFVLAGVECEIMRVRKNKRNGIIVDFENLSKPGIFPTMILPVGMKFNIVRIPK